jgi:hypothetical protein
MALLAHQVKDFVCAVASQWQMVVTSGFIATIIIAVEIVDGRRRKKQGMSEKPQADRGWRSAFVAWFSWFKVILYCEVALAVACFFAWRVEHVARLAADQKTSYDTNAVSFLECQIEFMELGNDPHLPDDPHGYYHFGFEAFNRGMWMASLHFFDLSLSNKPSFKPENYSEASIEPYYHLDVLRTNLEHQKTSGDTGGIAVATNRFKSDLDNMTNRIHEAVINRLPFNAFNSKEGLHNNLSSLTNMMVEAPPQVTNFISTIISAVVDLRGKAQEP